MKHQKPLNEESALRLVDVFLDGATTPLKRKAFMLFPKRSRRFSMSGA